MCKRKIKGNPKGYAGPRQPCKSLTVMPRSTKRHVPMLPNSLLGLELKKYSGKRRSLKIMIEHVWNGIMLLIEGRAAIEDRDRCAPARGGPASQAHNY